MSLMARICCACAIAPRAARNCLGGETDDQAGLRGGGSGAAQHVGDLPQELRPSGAVRPSRDGGSGAERAGRGL